MVANECCCTSSDLQSGTRYLWVHVQIPFSLSPTSVEQPQQAMVSEHWFPSKVPPAMLAPFNGHYMYSNTKVRTYWQNWNSRGVLS